MSARPIDRTGSPTRRVVGAVLCSLLVLALSSRSHAGPPEAEPERRDIRAAALTTYIHGMTSEIAHETIGVEGVPDLVELLVDPGFPRLTFLPLRSARATNSGWRG